MWRLVVPHILPSHAQAIDVIVHKRRDAVFRRDIRSENIQMRGIALVPIDHLLTPVAEDISLQIRRSLRPVVAHGMSHFAEMFSVAQRQRHRLLSVPLLQIRSKMRSATIGKQFVLQVAIPIDSEIHRRHLGRVVSNHFSMTIPYFLTV